MRDFIVLICCLTIFAIVFPTMATDKDGFNFYKDYLRARSDEGIPEIPVNSERLLYFYRTPMQLYPGLLPAALEQEYNKRTNAFKNHMLSKEMATEPDVPGKRSSKSALATFQTKHPRHFAQLMDFLGLSAEV